MFKRAAATAVLSLGLFALASTAAVADDSSTYQVINARTAISTWSFSGGATTGQVVIDLFNDKDQFTPGKLTEVHAILVSGNLTFCDSATNEQVTRDFAVFAPLAKKAWRFRRLNAASVNSWITLSGSETRFANCNAPDTLNPVFGSFSVPVRVALTWTGIGATQQSVQPCIPTGCSTMTKFRFATASGSLASAEPGMSMTLKDPSIAAFSWLIQIQADPNQGDDQEQQFEGAQQDD